MTPAAPTPADALATLTAVCTEAIRAAYGPATAAIMAANAQAMAGVLREALTPKPPLPDDKDQTHA